MSKSVIVSFESWMKEGLAAHIGFLDSFSRAKDFGLNAGYFFAMARDAAPDGDWQLFAENFIKKSGGKNSISLRSIQFYIQFTTEAMAWAQSEHPATTKKETLLELARKMVMQSPKGLVNLCRELGAMRKFGEYDEVAYAKRKVLGQQEFIFGYEACCSQLEALTRTERLEELHPKSLAALEEKLELSLAHVKTLRKTVEVEKS